jgi:hypothetical protein
LAANHTPPQLLKSRLWLDFAARFSSESVHQRINPKPAEFAIAMRPTFISSNWLPLSISFLAAGFLQANTAPVLTPRQELQPSTEGVVFHFDLTYLYQLDLDDPQQRRRFWDEAHLVFALQGLANRTTPALFVRWIRQPDDFWWQQMVQQGAWLDGRKVVRLDNLDSLLQHFTHVYEGAVVWDETVPATSNLASTIAGCDRLLPLRYDSSKRSLHARLTDPAPDSTPKVPVKTRLINEDGSALFTGQGTVPGTKLISTGSAKNDAYHWLIEHYLRSGKANPGRMGYYLDFFWIHSWQASAPENHTLSNHDFLVANQGLLFDLNVWDDEASVDDPLQKPGTDVATLKTLLQAAYDKLNGEQFIHVAGFVPWAYKYTDFKGAWSAGGGHQPVPTEWKYAEILSCFNAFMDADALGLSAMANASFFQHYPLAERYTQNPKPTRESLQARGLLDEEGRIRPIVYLAHYVGDYDAAAWLYRELPRLWLDPARGTTPLSWAFNPNLSERFPLGMAWARQHITTNDWFVAGDSGAGYLNPGLLTPPRIHSGLPSGLHTWEKHCRRFYQQWDITLTGFVIDGFGPGLSSAGLDSYARFSPDGIVAQKVPRQGVHNQMPFLRMLADIDGKPSEAAQMLESLASGSPPRFIVCRSILKSPSWYAQVESELKALAGNRMQVVDLYTLLWLVREYESNRAHHLNKSYSYARELAASPGQTQGLHPLKLADGLFQIVQVDHLSCWRLARSQTPNYLYFDADDSFQLEGGRVEIEVHFLDQGEGPIALQYDSSNPNSPHAGAYKPHPLTLRRTNSGQWRKSLFQLEDARFEGRQNGGADFRLYIGGDDLLVREVRIRISKF